VLTWFGDRPATGWCQENHGDASAWRRNQNGSEAFDVVKSRSHIVGRTGFPRRLYMADIERTIDTSAHESPCMFSGVLPTIFAMN
jgi:hypothetical protein